MRKFDAVVIGGGPGGYECAIRLSQNGLKTALVEKDELGGTCLNRGCIPTKALLHAAELYHGAKEAARFGVSAGEVRFDYAAMVQNSKDVSKRLRDGVAFLEKNHGVTVFHDSAVVSGGSFRMKGKAPKDAFLAVSVDGADYPFFNDGKPVRVNLADGTLTGSALNTKLTECEKRNQEVYAEYIRYIDEYDSLPVDEQEARAEEFMTQYRLKIKEYADFYVGLIEENIASLIPVAFVEHLPSVVSAADDWDKAAGEKKLAEVLEANPEVARHPYVIDLNRRLNPTPGGSSARTAVARSLANRSGTSWNPTRTAIPTC